ncbi:hypothetical protein QNH88_26595, partial [Klebsiella pneumoniae]
QLTDRQLNTIFHSNVSWIGPTISLCMTQLNQMKKACTYPILKIQKRENKELIYRNQKHSIKTAELILFSVYNDRGVFLG